MTKRGALFDLLLAALIGSYIAMLFHVAYGRAMSPGYTVPQEPVPSIWILAGFGLLISLFVLVGLCIFVYPLAVLFRQYVQRPLVGVIGTIWGGIAGSLMMVLFLIGMGEPLDALSRDFVHIAPFYGGFGTLCWWWLAKRRSTAADIDGWRPPSPLSVLICAGLALCVLLALFLPVR